MCVDWLCRWVYEGFVGWEMWHDVMTTIWLQPFIHRFIRPSTILSLIWCNHWLLGNTLNPNPSQSIAANSIQFGTRKAPRAVRDWLIAQPQSIGTFHVFPFRGPISSPTTPTFSKPKSICSTLRNAWAETRFWDKVWVAVSLLIVSTITNSQEFLSL